MSIFFNSSKAVEITQEAQVIQSDLKNNSEYGGAKYDLGITDFTPFGMLKAMPISIFTAIYRPFAWEALSPGLILNGIESVILFYLTFVFLFNNRGKRIGRIRESDILTFSLYFVIKSKKKWFSGIQKTC